MNIFQQIKTTVTARQAAEQYGLKVNRNGMVCCPFHNDRHPSMKVDKGFYCFACGAKGDVIHFVEKLYGISPLEAARKLEEDFQIPLESETVKQKTDTGRRKQPKKNSYQLKQEFERWERYCICILSDYRHLLENWKVEFVPRCFEKEWKDEFIEACRYGVYVDYYLDILLMGELEDRIDFILDKGKEVKKIERRMEQYRRKNNKKDTGSNQCDGQGESDIRICG